MFKLDRGTPNKLFVYGILRPRKGVLAYFTPDEVVTHYPASVRALDVSISGLKAMDFTGGDDPSKVSLIEGDVIALNPKHKDRLLAVQLDHVEGIQSGLYRRVLVMTDAREVVQAYEWGYLDECPSSSWLRRDKKTILAQKNWTHRRVR